MKIRIENPDKTVGYSTVIDTGLNDITVEDCFLGIGMETDQGLFGIAMRDDGIEVMLNGNLVWSSMSLVQSAEK